MPLDSCEESADWLRLTCKSNHLVRSPTGVDVRTPWRSAALTRIEHGRSGPDTIGTVSPRAQGWWVLNGEREMTGIDTLDERIIDELQVNGRLTMKALAEHVGLSSPAMIERVRRLEERGVIAGYRGVVAPAAIGRPLTAIVRAEVDRGSIDGFVKAIAAESGVVEAHRTSGLVNFVLKVHVADAASLEALIDTLGATGARCDADLVLSTPVAWRALTAPEGTVRTRTRLSRRDDETTRARPRTQPAAPEASDQPVVKRGPGRPKGSRKVVPASPCPAPVNDLMVRSSTR